MISEKQQKHLEKLNANQKGENNGAWKGGKIISSLGYVMILKHDHPRAKSNGGYVHEHILVMEEKIGRYIDNKKESVHHINGIKTDNRIENLVLMTICEHLSKHRKEFWEKLNEEEKMKIRNNMSASTEKRMKSRNKNKKGDTNRA